MWSPQLCTRKKSIRKINGFRFGKRLVVLLEDVLSLGSNEVCKHFAWAWTEKKKSIKRSCKPFDVLITSWIDLAGFQRSKMSADFEGSCRRVDLTQDGSLSKKERLLRIDDYVVKVTDPLAIPVFLKFSDDGKKNKRWIKFPRQAFSKVLPAFPGDISWSSRCSCIRNLSKGRPFHRWPAIESTKSQGGHRAGHICSNSRTSPVSNRPVRACLWAISFSIFLFAKISAQHAKAVN